MIVQKEVTLPRFSRGYHLVTRQILDALPPLPQTGLLHVFMKHTSAGLALNENADSSVRHDFGKFMDDLVPESFPGFIHNDEGPDDMPAHLKSSLIGQSLTIPISNFRLNLGTWQGIYLCEFRNFGGTRKLVITIMG